VVSRRRFTDKDRARIFAANDGCCHLCGTKIDGVREKWEVEHVIAWELTRDDSDENLKPAHKSCHKTKTHTQDRPAINEAKRREAKHQGVTRPAGKIKGPGFPAPKPKSNGESRHPKMEPKRLFKEAAE
jgi:5-methylcytosine-specific restriction protein A